MSLCPEVAKRAAMTDAEFWDYVLQGIEPGTRPDEYEFDADELQAVADLTPCVECGELGPCGYDDGGRPLVHVVTPEADA